MPVRRSRLPQRGRPLSPSGMSSRWLKGDRNHRLNLSPAGPGRRAGGAPPAILEQAEEFGCKGRAGPIGPMTRDSRPQHPPRRGPGGPSCQLLPPGAVGVQPRRLIGCHPLAIFRWMVTAGVLPPIARGPSRPGRHPRGICWASCNVVFVPLHSTEYMYSATAVPLVNVSSRPTVRLLKASTNTWHAPFRTLGRTGGGLLDYENPGSAIFQLEHHARGAQRAHPIGAGGGP